MGLADVRKLQAEGWAFADGGIKTSDCWAVWSAKGEDRKIQFLADPDIYPRMWEGA